MQLISNLNAAATAATLLRIFDFSKQHSFDLAGGGCTDLTPVQSFTIGATANQEWTMTATGGLGQTIYQIASKCNTFLTYPGAQSGASTFRSQATTRSTATDWTVSLVNPAIPTGPWNIIDAVTNAALTAWDHTTAPITLEELNATDTRQQFWFAAF
ncbi:hypothetical protein B0H16DRAFT_1603023 [Mycena metata]|uniref:Ricin B lectin domain-containing protein n=1 Tax=Mycena metata TaxID=1033252 RepID=A0AAD7MKQ2_9AGAR|nr:hypothetical protein B0H16DRAFT_1603023 [Mycena metata]